MTDYNGLDSEYKLIRKEIIADNKTLKLYENERKKKKKTHFKRKMM